MHRLAFDLEGNGLLPTVNRIHCIAAADIDTGQRFDWGPDDIPQALETLGQAEVLVAHYGLGYDFPALEKVYGFKPKAVQRDSAVIASLIYPNLRDTDGALVQAGKLPGKLSGKQKLEAWGYRLGNPKGDYKEAKEAEGRERGIEDPEELSEYVWGSWNPEMHSYMQQDVETLLSLWHHLKPDSYSQEAIQLEHDIAVICHMMRDAGWPFDVQKAQALYVDLLERRTKVGRELVSDMGFWFEPKGKKTKNEDGVVPYFTPKKDDKNRGYVKGWPCTQIEKVQFNPASRDHIIKKLLELGWRPTAFTPTGQPTVSDEVLEELSEQFPNAPKLVEFLLLNKRIGQLATGDKAWLTVVGTDGKMHGTINPMGTSTSRAAHYDPNMGQVPSSTSPLGHECRELFTVPPGWKLVGADMSGFQLRGLGHYLSPFDEGKYGKAVVSGDPHWMAVQYLGLAEGERDKENGLHEVLRQGSKTFSYATVFGCFDEKAGSIVRDCCVTARNKNPEWGHVFDRFFGKGQTNKQVGGRVRKAFYERLGLNKLLWKLKDIRASRKSPYPGSIPGLDGRWVPCRSDHAALAALLQSAEAIICKRWVVDSYNALIQRGLKWGWEGDFVFVGFVHDELQTAVREGLEQEVGKLITECAVNAGRHYNFRVPLSSEFKIGNNWYETH